MMTPLERAHGRFMRGPDGHEGAAGNTTPPGDSSGGQNNAGNITGVGNEEKTEDNGGQEKPLERFWEAKPEEGVDPDAEAERAKSSQELGKEIGAMISGFQAPEVFTKEIADAIADGDLKGVNQALNEHSQKLMQHQIAVTAKLLGGVIDRLSADFEAKIQKALGSKDNEIALETHFPLAKDAALRPMVQRVWDQALVNSKGNREKAIQLTRGMLDAFGEKMGGGRSLRDAPDDPTAGINTAPAKRLVEDLLSRE
jgi:hypothetical protein